MEARDEAVLGGHRAPRAVDGVGCVATPPRLDDLQEAAVRDDGDAVGLEDREERLVRLGDASRLGRDDGRLDLPHLAAVDEALAGRAR